jgi:hypothetical protein
MVLLSLQIIHIGIIFYFKVFQYVWASEIASSFQVVY